MPLVCLESPGLDASDSASDSEEANYVNDELTGLFEGQATLIVGTAFDAYFLQSLPAPKTSTNIFSNLLQPLTSDEYTSSLRTSSSNLRSRLVETHSSSFARFARELDEGFNLLFYGFGSKRSILNKLASDICSSRGHVIIANCFQPNFSLKEWLYSIERIPGILNLPLPSGGIEKQTRRIFDFFSLFPAKRRLFLVIHNIDAPIFRTSKAKSCLSLLTMSPSIHLIASVDHINAPLLWSSSEMSARKQGSGLGSDALRRGYSWLWHDLTTLLPYDTELEHADRSSISGASVLRGNAARHQQEMGGASSANVVMTDTAAKHILASVTQKAKRLFVLMGAKQLDRMDEASETAGNNSQQYALAYDILFNTARDNFIATNDTAMRSLLGEFRDHGLVLSAAQGGPGGGEVMWIPLRRERLAKILDTLSAE